MWLYWIKMFSKEAASFYIPIHNIIRSPITLSFHFVISLIIVILIGMLSPWSFNFYFLKPKCLEPFHQLTVYLYILFGEAFIQIPCLFFIFWLLFISCINPFLILDTSTWCDGERHILQIFCLSGDFSFHFILPFFLGWTQCLWATSSLHPYFYWERILLNCLG